MIEHRDGEEQYRRIGRGRIQDAIENWTDQERHHGVGRADAGHERNRPHQHRPIGPCQLEKTQPVLHACTRNLATAATTCSVETEAMPSALLRTSEQVLHGRHTSTFEEPKITTTGMPNAAAMCAGPESLPKKRAAFASRFLISASGAPASV